ncbi:SNF2-related protein [Alkalimarinus alittae]|uniref:SNF2-related protein n=1 Tax=Alkalimarinus alittae TaxID=2961619 RepID=A0ABY6N7C5_9ALTE|nr:SNF2-related protein [Alkalimarinus alittae]UZE97914.1 SNF2-related protein [Alkalimarinus alittae]
MGIRTPISWDGIINIASEDLDSWLNFLNSLGIPHEIEHTPENKARALTLDYSAIPGWNQAARNGKVLHQYQREGIEFATANRGRILNGDEMGTGKTVQTLGFAAGIHAERILIIAPANARYVWDREIKDWIGPEETIQHITSNLDEICLTTRWTIITYDVLVERPGIINISEQCDKDIISSANLDDEIIAWRVLENGDWRLTITMPVKLSGLTTKATKKLNRVNERLGGKLTDSLMNNSIDLLIADEAHYLKNPKAKRTKAVSRIANTIDKRLLLSGTPIRNTLEEVTSLLNLTCNDATQDINLLNKDSQSASAALTEYFYSDTSLLSKCTCLQ